MLWTALQDPDPVLIFEHGGLYNMEGELAADAGAVDIEKAAVRRAGTDVSLITYGGTLSKALQAAEELAGTGDQCRSCRPAYLASARHGTILASVIRTHRAVIIDEGWRSGGISAEFSARIMERAFYELDAPVARVCGAEVPMPYPKHLEEAAIPQAQRLSRLFTSWWEAVAEFRMPSLGADMEAGTLIQWLVKPGDAVKRGDIIAVSGHRESRGRD